MDISSDSSQPTSSVQSDSSQSKDGSQVDVLALLMNPSSDALSSKKPTKEELMAQRISKRAAKKSEIQEKAESHKRAGDSLFGTKNYRAAHSRYLEAIQLVGNVPEYYISLAATYRKLTWHEEAAHAATRALTIDPKNLEARYVRGVARLEQRLLHAAQTDFETVLEHDPAHLRASSAIAEVRQFLSQDGSGDVNQENAIVDFGFPHWDYEALEVASVSDSSDCQHVGNGVPCRFYNHDGCGKGSVCPYSHAPDEKSVRDDLGKNICIYHILDSCKFGASRCVYSHSKEALPKRGWWNSPEKVAKVKEVLEVAEKNAKEQRQAEADKWKAHLKEMRTGSRARQGWEKDATQKVEQPLKSPEVDKKAPLASPKKEAGVKKEVDQAKEIGVDAPKTTGKKAKSPTTPAVPAVKKKTHRFHNKRRNAKTGTVPSNAVVTGDPDGKQASTTLGNGQAASLNGEAAVKA